MMIIRRRTEIRMNNGDNNDNDVDEGQELGKVLSLHLLKFGSHHSLMHSRL